MPMGEGGAADGRGAIPPRDILKTPVALTVVGGRVVFEREP